MRMWMTPPEYFCKSHLLGEHGEIHKHRHNFVKGHSIAGRVAINAVEPLAMETRHDELAEEMLRRGYNHQSPYELPDLSHYNDEMREATVDTEESLKMLLDRCPECKLQYLKEVADGFT